MKNEINPQRLRNYWEPIYDPAVKVYTKWSPDEKTCRLSPKIKDVIIDISDYGKFPSNKLLKFLFYNADFNGKFDGGTLKFTFKQCVFNRCSFRDAELINVKFTKCDFDHTTFALGSFKNCEFRDCTYNQIGVSGNAMVLENCYLDPQLFLKSIFLNKKKSTLKENRTNLSYQKYKQAKTISVVARKLIDLQPIKNDIDFHILSIKIARKYEILASIQEAIFFLNFGKRSKKINSFPKLIYSSLELPVILLFGWLSGWGYKIGKTILIGLIGILCFTALNNILIFHGEPFLKSFLKTMEYWLLFGYTKYDFKTIPLKYQWVIFVNSIFGMIWFASLIPVIINKLGKGNE